MTTAEILENAKRAKADALMLDEKTKNEALMNMALSLEEETENILTENEKDVLLFKDTIGSVMIDRLTLTKERIKAMAEGIREVASLDDPCNEICERTKRPNGLIIEKKRIPMGVIAIIYESRPNVTSDAAALCIKSGNVCVLRCGKEAKNSASGIVRALKKGLLKTGLNENFISLVSDSSRESARELMEAVGYVDLLIPRGGKGLISACTKNAKVPCIQTGTGICHIYVDEYADFKKALDITENAKTSRPSVCNALESLIVNEKIAPRFLPLLKDRLTERENPVTLKCDERAFNIIGCERAGENDFDTEFLDYVLAVSVVSDVKEAIEHIRLHSTGHSESIITENSNNAELFLRAVDSAAVYWNASTRFTDGGEFGLGCEMGISTQKMHARGPMGLRELCSYKYIIRGNGQIR